VAFFLDSLTVSLAFCAAFANSPAIVSTLFVR
jgi:hypothetical protein